MKQSRLDVRDRAPNTADAPSSPGKRTLTSLHRARAHDAIAPGAEDAVAAAGTSSGAPLPADLRGRFESSLGADLSGVRVHTGGASAAAAESVGARAFALGQDIHFGAGQYNPGGDDFLIAHEVAHTVQQAGGAATPQYKLEVSAPGDAAEVEADAAARAMVSGAPAAVSGSARQVSRDLLGMYDAPPVLPARLEMTWDVPALPVPHDPEMFGMFSTPPSVVLTNESPAVQKIEDQLASDISSVVFSPKKQALLKRLDEIKSDWGVFTGDAHAVTSAAASAWPGLAEYFRASTKLKTDGSFTTLSDVTAQHKVGDNSTIGGVTTGPSLDSAAETAGNAKDDKGQRFVRDARDAALKADTAVRTQFLTTKQVALDYSNATIEVDKKRSQLKIRDAEKEKAAGEGDLATTETKIANIKDWIDAGTKVVSGIANVAQGAITDDYSKVVGGAADAYGAIGKKLVDLYYADDMKAAKAKIANAQAAILELGEKIDAGELAQALNNQQKAQLEMDKQAALLDQALRDRQSAYRHLGELAGKAIGGAEGEQLSGSFEAIPIISDLLETIGRIRGSFSLPSYTKASGRAMYEAREGTQTTMAKSVGLLRGFDSALADDQKDWQGKLSSLKSLADKLG